MGRRAFAHAHGAQGRLRSPAAARGASSKEAACSARAAGHAAATSHVRTHAPHAAAYALKALASSQDADDEVRWQAARSKVYGLGPTPRNAKARCLTDWPDRRGPTSRRSER